MTTITDRLRGVVYNSLQSFYAYPLQTYTDATVWSNYNATHRELLNTLLGYYFSNGLYDSLQIMPTSGADKVLSLRSPVAAFVGFYQSKLWSSPLTPLPATTDKGKQAALTDAIRDIWQRSKWDDNSDLAAFRFGLYGEMALQGAQRENGLPFLQVLDPRFVTDIERDERNFIHWLRYDVAYEERDPETGKTTAKMLTQVWQPGRVREWRYDKRHSDDDLSRLPTADYTEYTYSDGTLPIDFVPIAYAPFLMVDNGRGFSPILLSLEDIDEANRQATRLHAMYFRNEENTMVAEANYVSADGRPAAAPLIADNGSEITLPNGTRMFRMPGNSTLKFLVPPLNYEQGLAMLNAQLKHIRDDKLPELNYNITDSSNDESGKSRRYRLAAALDRIEKARARAEDCLIRATYMALTLGQAAYLQSKNTVDAKRWRVLNNVPLDTDRLELYSPERIGTYDAGDWAFSLQSSEILPLTLEEQSMIVTQLANVASVEGAARIAGMSEQEVELLTAIDTNPPEQ
jgi:hypothetical protein